MADSGYRAFHDGCGGLVAFGIGGDGFCTACEDENVGFADYTLAAVKPPAGTGEPDDMPPPPDDALRTELATLGVVLGDVIGLAPVPGEACDSATASVMQMPDGTTVCRCVVCPRCGHHTGNSHQGHNWGMCKATRTIRVPHFCCGNEFGCELEASDG